MCAFMQGSINRVNKNRKAGGRRPCTGLLPSAFSNSVSKREMWDIANKKRVYCASLSLENTVALEYNLINHL